MMSVASISPVRRAADAERRERIVEAAERAFVRHGFHAATMQHVADEAGMSPGNLYRYFPSKEAIVEGLCEVDKMRRAGSFSAFADFMARNGDLAEAIRSGMREHVLSKPPEKARMIVEIWAEAGRNPRVAEITKTLDADVLSGLERLIDVAKAAGAASPQLDPPLRRPLFRHLRGRSLQADRGRARFQPRRRDRQRGRRSQGAVRGQDCA